MPHRHQRVSVGSTDDVSLTPEDCFLLSQVDGTVSVADLVQKTGLPAKDVEHALERLISLGVLRVGEPASFVRSSKKSTAEPPVDGARPEGPELPMVGPDDPRIDGDHSIPVPTQRWLLALEDGQQVMNPFEFLGLRPTDDVAEIRRAFRAMSRRLHPDSYFRCELGRFRDVLSTLFRRARFYESQLRKPEVRALYVRPASPNQPTEEPKPVESIHALPDPPIDEDALLERRRARKRRQLERERQRLQHRLSDEAHRHVVDAEAAEAAGKLAQAANLYRLALKANPGNADIQARWKRCRARAQQKRASEAFSQAVRLAEFGHSREAVPLFIEAAQAHGTVEHLSFAADAVRESDVEQARAFALDALRVLAAEPHRTRKPAELAVIHVMLGRAFLSAGQTESAKEQALLARALRADDPEVRALLRRLKAR